MKFGHIRQYNMRIIFREKSYTLCVGETIPRPFFTISELSESLDQCLKFCTVYFHCVTSSGLSKYIETADHLLLPHMNLF